MEAPAICQEIPEVIETFIRDNRFYVRIKKGAERVETLPRANYVWLKSNPGFKQIPAAYVVHHLDWDQTNDDRTNLVIMQKYLHSAYHWKHKVTGVKINISEDNVDVSGLTNPKVYKRSNVYHLSFYANGMSHRVWRNFNGEKLLTQESAERLAEEICEKKYYLKTWSKNTYKNRKV